MLVLYTHRTWTWSSASTAVIEKLDMFSFKFSWLLLILWHIQGPVMSFKMAVEIQQNHAVFRVLKQVDYVKLKGLPRTHTVSNACQYISFSVLPPQTSDWSPEMWWNLPCCQTHLGACSNPEENTILNSLATESQRYGSNFTKVFFKLIYELKSWALLVNVVLGQYHRSPLIISHHWFR